MSDSIERDGRGEADDEEPLLAVEDLKTHYPITKGWLRREVGRIRAVDGATFSVGHGEVVGLVEESGSGKSTTAASILGLEEPTDGEIYFDGQPVTELEGSDLRAFRRRAQLIVQDPNDAFNPRLTVGEAVAEPLRLHGMADESRRRGIVENLLERVGLSATDADRYPHEFSGGQKQRIGIARALAVDPDVIICDEPVSALDVSVQAQILNLLEDLQERFDLSYIFIAHDLSVVEHISDRVAVMYLGKFAEVAPTEEVYAPPYHPYTEALLSAIPEPDPLWEGEQIFLPGAVPSPINPPSGCRFHTRCPRIVQSPEYDLDQQVWRALLTLKQRAREAESINAILAMEDDVEAGVETDPREMSTDELDRLVRAEFELPDRMDDPTAEREFVEVMELLSENDDLEAAARRLDEAFSSPCEKTDPEGIYSSPTHQIACLLYDGRDEDSVVNNAVADD